MNEMCLTTKQKLRKMHYCQECRDLIFNRAPHARYCKICSRIVKDRDIKRRYWKTKRKVR